MFRRMGAAVVVLALVAGCSGAEPDSDDGPPAINSSSSRTPATPSSNPTFEPREDLIVGRIETGAGSGPSGVALGPGAVWVTAHRTAELLRIDPRTREVVARVAVPRAADYLEAPPIVTRDAVLLCVGPEPERVLSLDPATNEVRTKRLGCQAYGHGPLGTWVASGDRLTQIDPVSLRVLRVLRPDVSSLAFNADLVQAGGSLWLSHAGDSGELYRVDPRSGEVLGHWKFGFGNYTLAALGTRVYFTNPVLHEVSVVDATTNTVTLTAYVPGSDEGDPILTAAYGELWASTLHGGLARLDPETLEVLASADFGYQDHVGKVAVGDDRIWYPTYGGDQVLEVRSDF